MSKDREKLYDEMVMVAYTNLYTLSKKNREIYLNGFDPHNESHRALYSIASMLSSNYQFPMHVGCKLLTYWRYKKIFKPYAFATRKTLKDGLTCDEMIAHIEKAFEKPGVFKDIYTAYYKMGK